MVCLKSTQVFFLQLLLISSALEIDNVQDANFSLIPRLGNSVRTTMSTAYNGFNSSLAIDGKAGHPDICSCCSVANGQTPGAWLEINLGKKYFVSGIQIYGRMDVSSHKVQSTDIDVFIGNTSLKHKTLSNPLLTIQNNDTTYPFTKDLKTTRMFQFLFLHKRNSGYMSICEVQLREDTNLVLPIRGMIHTRMSTVYYETGKNFAADLAVDGDAHTNASTCSCCSATDGSSSPWWQLDLGRKYLVSKMELIGTKENASQSQNVDVYISNRTLLQGNAPIPKNDSLFSAVSDFSGSLYSIHETTMFQFLMVRRWYQSFLTICELKLYAQECDYGRYGKGCRHSCHCSNNAKCDAATGHCPSGCSPGYTRDACDTACTNGSYGQHCGHHCHCANGAVCDTRNGSCPVGCDVGWLGQKCQTDDSLLSKVTNPTTTASSILDGLNASLALDGLDDYLYTSFSACKCCSVIDGNNPWWQVDLGAKYLVGAVYVVGSHTKPDSQSKNINIIGSNDTATVNDTTNILFNVTTSTPGTRFLHNFTVHPRMLRYLRIQKWTNTILAICEVRLIEGKCQPGWFGDKCRRRCHCADQKACNPVDGRCQSALCTLGWRGSACDIACEYGTFGQNCSGVAHCINGTANNILNGSCQVGVCAPGWKEHACDTACEAGRFGQNCSDVAHCKNGTANNNVNGRCWAGVCDPGWRGDACDTVCVTGRFGQNCSGDAHCFNDTANNNVDGNCLTGSCDPGWKGDACDKECNPGTFGNGCFQVCHCHGDRSCAPADGICPDVYPRCARGWQGRSCDQECKAYFYGLNCSEECGGCKHDAPCDSESGICPYGCAEGYTGDTCTKITNKDQTEITSSDSKLVGPIVGGSSAIVACLVVVSILLIMNFRRKQRKDTNETSNTDNVYTQPNLYLTPTESSVYDTLDTVKNETIERVASSHDYVNEKMETVVL